MTTNQQPQGRYNLFTALAMIVGIVIGSGIFFKADDVLKYTGGNIWLGVVVFTLAAFAIIFGSLAFAELAKRSDSHGGLIGYADEFISPHFSTVIGWFQTFLYFPTLCAIIAWVVGMFFTLLFGMQDASFELQIGIGLVWLVSLYALNIFSARLAGKFQVLSTIIKLIPLFVIGLLTFFKGDFSNFFTTPQLSNIEPVVGLAWLGAVGPIAFAFDGWVVSTSISGEIKNSKRNLPIALVVAPLLILVGYLIYFVGLSSYLGAEKVLELGNDSVGFAASQLFGETAGKALLAFVVISVMGTLNGLVLGFIRLPYSLALSGRIPFAKALSEVSPTYQIPLKSAALTFGLSLLWLFIHYITTKTEILGKMDISEISVVVSYMLYMVFYYTVFKMWRNGVIKNAFFGVIVPIFASLGSAFIFFGGMQNPMFLTVCIPVCLLVLGSAYFYSKNKVA
ncbi:MULTISPECIES: APC family permease [unclassified Acinetobacter]|uniref:APC family permease n=1 Tax=unclassified Acinetobacter TaxID=196816 RepID=UPI0035BA590A